MLREVVRNIIGCRSNESYVDTLSRHRSKIRRLFYRKKYSKAEFRDALLKIGITNGDNLMVHSSWREFYNYDGSPNDVIDTILSIIGREGTLSMPSFGEDRRKFDVDNDKSVAGVLSEVFRTDYPSIRSKGSHFACSSLGKNAKKILEGHEASVYGFDEHSPYYRFTTVENAKVVLLGLKKGSIKLSLYHLPEWILKDEIPFYADLFSGSYNSVVSYSENGTIKTVNHEMMLRKSAKPNSKNIKKIYYQPFVTSLSISNLEIILIDAKKALQYLLNESKNGTYMIIPRKNSTPTL